MEDRFDNRDFEQFVKQNADQYRMFPSEKVWNSIHHTLHARRRWYGIGLSLLLLTTAVVTWVMLLGPSGKKQTLAVTASPSTKNIIEQKHEPAAILVTAKPSRNKQGTSSTASLPPPQNLFFASANNELTGDDSYSAITITTNNDAILATQQISTQPAILKRSSPVQSKELLIVAPVAITRQKPEIYNPEQNPVEQALKNPGIVAASPADQKNAQEKDSYPLSIESVVNSYRHTRNRKKLSWQVYVVPTISYRELKENMAFIRAARSNGTIPTNTLMPDLNSVVNHKPDIGFELGFNTGYPVSQNFKIIAGLQFNVSKYDIRAFNYQSEITTIALNSGGGANSVSTTSNYRSYGASNKANWLRNLYFSASAPVGAEIVFNSSKKMYAGFTGTIQPTYMLSNKTYLLSTDYKNYAEVPSLTRKWNLNTGFEVFAGYATGKLEWRVGPQVRYQTLSTFKDKYPVREHLFDFGLKVGVMLK